MRWFTYKLLVSKIIYKIRLIIMTNVIRLCLLIGYEYWKTTYRIDLIVMINMIRLSLLIVYECWKISYRIHLIKTTNMIRCIYTYKLRVLKNLKLFLVQGRNMTQEPPFPFLLRHCHWISGSVYLREVQLKSWLFWWSYFIKPSCIIFMLWRELDLEN